MSEKGLCYPDKVTVVEVGPRDGFQNIRSIIPLEVKLRAVDMLAAAGVKEIEVASFVHPKAVPQMADAAELAREAVARHGRDVRLTALVPNARGAENALKSGIKSVVYVISVSEAHNRANVNRGVAESCEGLRELIRNFPDLDVTLDAATVFGCPFEGEIPVDRVFALLDAAAECGVRGITLCDTIGIAAPKQVYDISRAARARYCLPLGLHLHDTRGQGLANSLAGLLCGMDRFESSAGGLGGCPFAPGAAGNTATEDFLYMLAGLGIETGIDFGAYMEAARYLKASLPVPLTGRMIQMNPEGCQ